MNTHTFRRVQTGCVRYEIDNPSSGDDKTSNNMEFFTVFSASRYPYKEGFNQGAVLELKANGRHDVLRYETEDDEPIEDADTTNTKSDASFDTLAADTSIISSEEEENDSTNACSISSGAVRRSLFEAIAFNRLPIYVNLSKLLSSLSANSSGDVSTEAEDAVVQVDCDDTIKGENIVGSSSTAVPFDDVVDVIISSLRLDNKKALRKIGAKTALAKAFGVECPDTRRAPDTVNLKDLIENIRVDTKEELYKHIGDVDVEERHGMSSPSMSRVESYAWLYSVFEIIDVDQNGFLEEEEWNDAVEKINSKLPSDLRIDPVETWKFLDANHDGKVSMKEWEKLGYALTSSKKHDILSKWN